MTDVGIAQSKDAMLLWMAIHNALNHPMYSSVALDEALQTQDIAWVQSTWHFLQIQSVPIWEYQDSDNCMQIL